MVDPTTTRRTVVIAGATGYAGRFIVKEYQARGWKVIALTRRQCSGTKDDLGEDRDGSNQIEWRTVQVVADPKSLQGCMDGADLVVSALGLTRQNDGLTYRQVDYQANVNLLEEALRTKVPHFCYIHVLHADQMLNVPLVAAKHDFVQYLQSTEGITSTVVCPSGFFSDMKDFLEMAQQGRVYLFGEGSNVINPIHGRDLAKATADAVQHNKRWLDVGGPDKFTHKELAELAFRCMDKAREPKITCLPDWTRRLALVLVPWVTPRSIAGPAVFFLSAMAIPEMVGECHGEHHLRDFFTDQIAEL